HHRPFEQLAGLQHAVELGVAHEPVVLAALLEAPCLPRGRGNRENQVRVPLHQRPRQTRLPRPARRGDHHRERPAPHTHSTFSICSRRRSTSFLIVTTSCSIAASFAFEPMVFASRCISCTRKPSRLPTGSPPGSARSWRNSSMCERRRTVSSLMSHRSARYAIS